MQGNSGLGSPKEIWGGKIHKELRNDCYLITRSQTLCVCVCVWNDIKLSIEKKSSGMILKTLLKN